MNPLYIERIDGIADLVKKKKAITELTFIKYNNTKLYNIYKQFAIKALFIPLLS